MIRHLSKNSLASRTKRFLGPHAVREPWVGQPCLSAFKIIYFFWPDIEIFVELVCTITYDFFICFLITQASEVISEQEWPYGSTTLDWFVLQFSIAETRLPSTVYHRSSKIFRTFVSCVKASILNKYDF